MKVRKVLNLTTNLLNRKFEKNPIAEAQVVVYDRAPVEQEEEDQGERDQKAGAAHDGDDSIHALVLINTSGEEDNAIAPVAMNSGENDCAQATVDVGGETRDVGPAVDDADQTPEPIGLGLCPSLQPDLLLYTVYRTVGARPVMSNNEEGGEFDPVHVMLEAGEWNNMMHKQELFDPGGGGWS